MLFDTNLSFTKETIDKYFLELSKEYKKLGGRNSSNAGKNEKETVNLM